MRGDAERQQGCYRQAIILLEGLIYVKDAIFCYFQL